MLGNLYAEFPPFKKGKLISLTEREELNPDDIQTFTNLLTIYSVASKLKPLYHKQPKTREFDLVNVETLYKVVCDFFEFSIKNFPSLNDFFGRRLDIKTARYDQKNLLFRPVGLVLIAKLYVYYKRINALEKLGRAASLFKFDSPQSHFERVLITSGKIEGRERSQKVAYSLSLFLLGELSVEQVGKFTQEYEQLTKNPASTLPRPFTV